MGMILTDGRSCVMKMVLMIEQEEGMILKVMINHLQEDKDMNQMNPQKGLVEDLHHINTKDMTQILINLHLEATPMEIYQGSKEALHNISDTDMILIILL